jgi:hypothetical protein
LQQAAVFLYTEIYFIDIMGKYGGIKGGKEERANYVGGY